MHYKNNPYNFLRNFAFVLATCVFANLPFSPNIFAQTTVQIGTSDDVNPSVSFSSPLLTSHDYSYTQQIVTASEFSNANGTAGFITKIRWLFPVLGNTADYGDWDVYIGHTTQASFASGSNNWIPAGNLTQVFTGNIHEQAIPPTAGQWFEIPFSTPFEYNGTDNIVVAVNEKTPGHNSTTTIRSYWTQNDPKQAISAGKNNTILDPTNMSGTYGNANSRVPQMQFQMGSCTDMPNAGIVQGSVPEICVVTDDVPTFSTDGDEGGVWSTSNPAIATFDENGELSILQSGNIDIIYTILASGVCPEVSASAPLLIKAMPETGTIDGEKSVCVDQTISLIPSVSGGEWSSSNANAQVNDDGVVTGKLSGPTTIFYAVTDNGCTATKEYPIMVVAPLTVTINNGADTVQIGNKELYTASPTNGTWASSDPDVASFDDNTGELNAKKTGQVTITYAVNNVAPCTGTSEATKVVTIVNPSFMKVNESLQQNLNLRLFPNPTNGKVRVEFAPQQDSESTISVVNLSGKILDTIVVNKGESSILLNLATYANGIYSVVVRTEHAWTTQKLFIAK